MVHLRSGISLFYVPCICANSCSNSRYYKRGILIVLLYDSPQPFACTWWELDTANLYVFWFIHYGVMHSKRFWGQWSIHTFFVFTLRVMPHSLCFRWLLCLNDDHMLWFWMTGFVQARLRNDALDILDPLCQYGASWYTIRRYCHLVREFVSGL